MILPVLTWRLIALGLCLLCSAFFSASETALLSLPRARIFKLAGQSPAGRLIRKAVEKPDRLLGAILLGNNLFNVAGSVLGTAIFLELWGGGSLAAATVSLTVIFLILAEVTPKTLAAFSPEKVSLIVIRPLNLFLFVFQPVVKALTWISRSILSLAGQPTDREGMVTRDDLVTLVLSGRREGYLDRIEQRMLHGVLEISRIDLGEVMVPLNRVQSFDGALTAAQALERAAELPYSRYPVYLDDPEKIIGYVHLRDLLSAPSDSPVKELVHPCFFVPESRTVQGQLLAFRREQVTLAFVVDEFGRILGLVTMEDVLEEIVGEIIDEFDSSQVGVAPVAGGGFLVDGRLTIREINRLTGLRLPEKGPYHTLSGLVQTLAQKIPAEGEVYPLSDWELAVETMDGKAVGRVWIRPKLKG